LELDEKILNQIGMDELVMLDKDGNLMDSDVGKYIPIIRADVAADALKAKKIIFL
jgi:hypothetical protein